MSAHRRIGRRAVGAASVALVASIVMLMVGASPASAHAAANSPASNYVSTVHSVTPKGYGFTVKVIEAGSRLELRWTSGAEVLIPDYDGHPYLRVGPSGVEENEESNAVYLNRSRLGSTPIPDNLNPAGPPKWKKLSSSTLVRWHDHRIHWMSTSLPPSVSGSTGQRHLVQNWDVPLTQGSQTFDIKGSLEWVPGPSPAPYLVLAAGLIVATVAFSVWAARSPKRRMLAMRVVGVAVLALVAVDVVHLVGIAFGVKGTFGAAMGRVVSIGYVSVAAWALALAGIVLILRRRDDALYLITFSAGLMAIVSGLADFSVLSRTSVPFAFPVPVSRFCVAVTLGLGIGVAVAGVLLTRPSAMPPVPTSGDEPIGSVPVTP